MAILHKKEFGIYHWDTFDNETILVGEANTRSKAIKFVEDKYGEKRWCRPSRYCGLTR